MISGKILNAKGIPVRLIFLAFCIRLDSLDNILWRKDDGWFIGVYERRVGQNEA
jgi:hypothetical protein